MRFFVAFVLLVGAYALFNDLHNAAQQTDRCTAEFGGGHVACNNSRQPGYSEQPQQKPIAGRLSEADRSTYLTPHKGEPLDHQAQIKLRQQVDEYMRAIGKQVASEDYAFVQLAQENVSDPIAAQAVVLVQSGEEKWNYSCIATHGGWGATDLKCHPTVQVFSNQKQVVSPPPALIDNQRYIARDVASNTEFPTAKPTHTILYIRPNAAPNGHPWPASAGYVAGYKRLNATGLSTLTVDNTQNDSDVFLKLMALNGSRARPVRWFFIPGHDKFTVRALTKGSYDVRYRDLARGSLFRSQTFSVVEFPVRGARKFSNITMTLYKVLNGNMETVPISEKEFED